MKMMFSSSKTPAAAAFIVVVMATVLAAADGQALVPAVNIFGDSVMDVGNNNGRLTLVKADFPPYGRDFANHTATGRFCNGKLAADFTVENLGFGTYPPAYLSEEAVGYRLLDGANFASASSGYMESTAILYGAITLKKQVDYFKEYKEKVAAIVGPDNATTIFNGSIYLLSAGSSDYLQNYYINPILRILYSPDDFADKMVNSFAEFAEDLYGLGARRIGVTSLPPIGCLPAAITIFGKGRNDCVRGFNDDAASFNTKLSTAAAAVKERHSDLKIVVFDVFTPLMNLIQTPQNYSFFETRKACCGTGLLETSLMCNKFSVGTCANATGYVFWDSFHTTESANLVLSEALIEQGIDLISGST